MNKSTFGTNSTPFLVTMTDRQCTMGAVVSGGEIRTGWRTKGRDEEATLIPTGARQAVRALVLNISKGRTKWCERRWQSSVELNNYYYFQMVQVISIVFLHLLKEHKRRRLFNRYKRRDRLNVLKKTKTKKQSTVRLTVALQCWGPSLSRISSFYSWHYQWTYVIQPNNTKAPIA